jgi:hypothetical protein
MIIESQAADPRTHEVAIRIARRCRKIVQACLREEEWADADREFYRVARDELQAMHPAGRGGPPEQQS